jgi:hypothetical protein
MQAPIMEKLLNEHPSCRNFQEFIRKRTATIGKNFNGGIKKTDTRKEKW